MGDFEVYTDEEFENYKGIACGLNKITEEKLARTQSKGLCYWCEKRNAKFPTYKPQLCVLCFITIITDKLEKVAKFGSEKIDFSLSEEQKEKNKLKANETLARIREEPEKFAEEYEQEILKVLEKEVEPLRFFEDN